MAVVSGDFLTEDVADGIPGGKGKGKKRLHEGDKGEPRPYLRVYETMPCTWLNAYGQAQFNQMKDKAVWENMGKKLKSGALWNSEYCAADKERHGTAFNRFLQTLLAWMMYQEEEKGKISNQALLAPNMHQLLYKEISVVKESVEYLLAPRKEKVKSGTSVLRAGVPTPCGGVSLSLKSPEELDRCCKIVYEQLLDMRKPSKIRLIMAWQSAGGLSFVSGAHYRGTMCFMQYGCEGGPVSLEHLQEAVKQRHATGTDGTEQDYAQVGQSQAEVDLAV